MRTYLCGIWWNDYTFYFYTSLNLFSEKFSDNTYTIKTYAIEWGKEMKGYLNIKVSSGILK
jgi:hypothetical protein